MNLIKPKVVFIALFALLFLSNTALSQQPVGQIYTTPGASVYIIPSGWTGHNKSRSLGCWRRWGWRSCGTCRRGRAARFTVPSAFLASFPTARVSGTCLAKTIILQMAIYFGYKPMQESGILTRDRTCRNVKLLS